MIILLCGTKWSAESVGFYVRRCAEWCDDQSRAQRRRHGAVKFYCVSPMTACRSRSAIVHTTPTHFSVNSSFGLPIKTAFHYADFPVTSETSPRRGIFGEVGVMEFGLNGTSRVCRGCHGEVGIVGFGLKQPLVRTAFASVHACTVVADRTIKTDSISSRHGYLSPERNTWLSPNDYLKAG